MNTTANEAMAANARACRACCLRWPGRSSPARPAPLELRMAQRKRGRRPRPGRPNILWLVARGHEPEHRPPSADPTVRTPNLERLAAEGVRFTNVYSVSGVCSPSRAALATGMYPTGIGAHHMRTIHQQEEARRIGPH